VKPLARLARRPEMATALALAVLVALAAARYPGFFSARVALDLFGDNAVLGLAALGASVVILSGGIDLSVGAVMACASILLAILVGPLGWPIAWALAAVLALGAAYGLAMGALIQGLALPAFVVTLAGLFLARGIALRLHLESLPIARADWTALSRSGVELGPGLRLSAGAMLLFAATAVAAWVLGQTRLGRNVYAVGGNAEAALLAGVPVARTRVAVYGVAGFASALAGVAYALYASSGSSTAGAGLELEAIAAAVIGGTRLAGGVGTAVGTLLGVMVFGVVQTVLIFEGTLGAGWTRVAIGALLLAFIALQRARSWARGRGMPGEAAG
jgi:ribose/xylose/arabinose/galactoside ABC-type transport system permease subunit